MDIGALLSQLGLVGSYALEEYEKLQKAKVRNFRELSGLDEETLSKERVLFLYELTNSILTNSPLSFKILKKATSSLRKLPQDLRATLIPYARTKLESALSGSNQTVPVALLTDAKRQFYSSPEVRAYVLEDN